MFTITRARKNLSELLSTEEKTTVSRRSSGISSFGGADLDKEQRFPPVVMTLYIYM
jgi:hypothetical protein